jgi:hypothetical protein
MDDWQNRIEKYRLKADEMRGFARTAHVAESGELFLQIASEYDDLAQRTARERDADMQRRNQGINTKAD